jgi:hypothetical protein
MQTLFYLTDCPAGWFALSMVLAGAVMLLTCLVLDALPRGKSPEHAAYLERPKAEPGLVTLTGYVGARERP